MTALNIENLALNADLDKAAMSAVVDRRFDVGLELHRSFDPPLPRQRVPERQRLDPQVPYLVPVQARSVQTEPLQRVLPVRTPPPAPRCRSVTKERDLRVPFFVPEWPHTVCARQTGACLPACSRQSHRTNSATQTSARTATLPAIRIVVNAHALYSLWRLSALL